MTMDEITAIACPACGAELPLRYTLEPSPVHLVGSDRYTVNLALTDESVDAAVAHISSHIPPDGGGTPIEATA